MSWRNSLDSLDEISHTDFVKFLEFKGWFNKKRPSERNQDEYYPKKGFISREYIFPPLGWFFSPRSDNLTIRISTKILGDHLNSMCKFISHFWDFFLSRSFSVLHFARIKGFPISLQVVQGILKLRENAKNERRPHRLNLSKFYTLSQMLLSSV